MKPFNLDEYLANPSMKVVTREGKPVRIICTDFNNRYYPIVIEVKGMFAPVSVTREGRHVSSARDKNLDLFFAPEKHEGWVNIYKAGNGRSTGSYIWSTEEDAKKDGNNWDNYVATVKIEWEE